MGQKGLDRMRNERHIDLVRRFAAKNTAKESEALPAVGEANTPGERRRPDDTEHESSTTAR